jgi:hypothetical protein
MEGVSKHRSCLYGHEGVATSHCVTVNMMSGEGNLSKLSKVFGFA